MKGRHETGPYMDSYLPSLAHRGTRLRDGQDLAALGCLGAVLAGDAVECPLARAVPLLHPIEVVVDVMAVLLQPVAAVVGSQVAVSRVACQRHDRALLTPLGHLCGQQHYPEEIGAGGAAVSAAGDP